MFGLGWPEIGVIALAGVIVFGPKKIPEMGKVLGKSLRKFKEELVKPAADEVAHENQDSK